MRRREAGKAAETSTARKSVYAEKFSSVRSCNVYFWFEPNTRSELLEPVKDVLDFDVTWWCDSC